MKIESAPSLFDAFMPHAHQKELTEELELQGRRVTNGARFSALFGMALLVVFVAEILTIPFIAGAVGIHIVIGLIAVPLVLAKIAVAAYRFTKFYAGDTEFVAAGPPWLPLRILAPLLVATTVLVIGSGIEMVVAGPTSFSDTFLAAAHTLLSLIWFFLLGLHALAYYLRSYHSARKDISSIIGRFRSRSKARRGAALRLSVLMVTVSLGVLLSLQFRSQVRSWEKAFLAGVDTYYSTPTAKSTIAKYPSRASILAKKRLEQHLKSAQMIRAGDLGSQNTS
ncbi:hypothetical protein SAMN02745225_01095 [Ferrithrix thermotolerans DSM 19514]|uniref:Uncharacterized protein n=1 Tax=Ferrithrix thermotolerans DSM 19514 TaxID=1121881 RepID=A0A1M4UUF1_9ACTN|nr:hypothetical protein [Ferrithrix thermotolerans]SHE60277.1 hypothetical protein SAMN02745225_01095 [Ferrithrix thermotolerans DSM 19514]